MKNQYIAPDYLKSGSEFELKEGVVFFRVVDTPMPTMIILSHLKLLRKDLPKLNSSILMEIVTIPIGQVYALPHKSLVFCKKFL